jgi:hypothetical protein
MKKYAGQRWRFSRGDLDIVLEIIAVSPWKVKILTSNDIAKSWGHKPGNIMNHGMGIETDYQGWSYLEGQDAP